MPYERPFCACARAVKALANGTNADEEHTDEPYVRPFCACVRAVKAQDLNT